MATNTPPTKPLHTETILIAGRRCSVSFEEPDLPLSPIQRLASSLEAKSDVLQAGGVVTPAGDVVLPPPSSLMGVLHQRISAESETGSFVGLPSARDSTVCSVDGDGKNRHDDEEMQLTPGHQRRWDALQEDTAEGEGEAVAEGVKLNLMFSLDPPTALQPVPLPAAPLPLSDGAANVNNISAISRSASASSGLNGGSSSVGRVPLSPLPSPCDIAGTAVGKQSFASSSAPATTVGEIASSAAQPEEGEPTTTTTKSGEGALEEQELEENDLRKELSAEPAEEFEEEEHDRSTISSSGAALPSERRVVSRKDDDTPLNNSTGSSADTVCRYRSALDAFRTRNKDLHQLYRHCVDTTTTSSAPHDLCIRTPEATAFPLSHLIGSVAEADPRAWICGKCREVGCGRYCQSCGAQGLWLGPNSAMKARSRTGTQLTGGIRTPTKQALSTPVRRTLLPVLPAGGSPSPSRSAMAVATTTMEVMLTRSSHSRSPSRYHELEWE